MFLEFKKLTMPPSVKFMQDEIFRFTMELIVKYLGEDILLISVGNLH